LGFHLERHVIFPHYRDVNIFVDVTLGGLPLGAFVTFLSLTNNCVISYFHDHKNPFVLCICVFSTKGTILGVCVCVFYPMCFLLVFSLFTSNVPPFSFSFLGIHFKFNLEVLITMLNKGFEHANK